MGAYIILGAATLLVICLAFHIITIDSTNPLHICPIVFSIRPPRLWNSLPETCRCASSLGSFRTHLKDISLDEVIPTIAFCYINIPGWFLTCFPTTDYGFDYINDLCVQNAFSTQIRRYRNTTD